MLKKFWSELKMWMIALEGVDDPRGDYLEKLEQRVRSLERAVEGLQGNKAEMVANDLR